VDLSNDPEHCGACTVSCSWSTGFCNEARCTLPSCRVDTGCESGRVCCGDQCCEAGTICCAVHGPGPQRMVCSPGPSCPSSCPTCR
jgi:hypothetical protein